MLWFVHKPNDQISVFPPVGKSFCSNMRKGFRWFKSVKKVLFNLATKIRAGMPTTPFKHEPKGLTVQFTYCPVELCMFFMSVLLTWELRYLSKRAFNFCLCPSWKSLLTCSPVFCYHPVFEPPLIIMSRTWSRLRRTVSEVRCGEMLQYSNLLKIISIGTRT